MAVRSGELLFVKSVKDGIPNRDPLNESDARRLFDEEDGRISLSDVSIKRDVRDYVLARYPDGGPEKNCFIFVREEKTEDGKLLGRGSLAAGIQSASGRSGSMETVLKQSAFDVRVFGAVYSVAKQSFQVTGPVQFGWAHSLHPVETRYVQGTVVMPSADVTKKSDSDVSEGKQQGTIWTTYTLPFAVFLMPGVINAQLAAQTGMSEADTDLLLEALWKGTQYRQARGRGLQQPLFLLHVEYSDPFFRIGYLDEYVRLLPERDVWRSPHPPTSVSEVTLDVTRLAEVLQMHRDRIARVRVWVHSSLAVRGELIGEKPPLW